ncbi:hypothetical protein DL95DRAFT_415177 [Leptodontidium sp. 2 PMI_412]|nr:hypothetical protein DL95DRAFT_415177 [Leptodontidium sp. 2 PMI_412]
MQRQSLRCRQIDPDSSWECALRSGDRRMWHHSSVLTNSPPDATSAEIVRGGVVYHTGDTSSIRPGDSHGKFLPGEMLCALTIILHQLFHLPVETKRPSPDISARIVSITSSFLRVLEIRYNTDTHGITCEVLTSGNLSFVKEQADSVDSKWIAAIELALDIQISIPFY